LQCNVLTVLSGSAHLAWFREFNSEGIVRSSLWDLMIAHPPCTHLAVSGARWFKEKAIEQAGALEFVRRLLSAPIQRIALGNPVSVISSKIRKPDQIVHPWMFGHGETKATCLWLKNLPKLKPTNVVEGREGRVWKMGPSPDRWKDRSRTYEGIAKAMAEQWGRQEPAYGLVSSQENQPIACFENDSQPPPLGRFGQRAGGRLS
jgi:hypothetical protein